MRRVVLIVALVVVASGIGILVLRGRCDDGKELVEFPYVIQIAPKNILFVDGHEFHGEVVCTWEPGDSLRIEGIPVLPRRPPPFRAPRASEQGLQRIYGEVPFVVGRVNQGVTWSTAVREYHRRNSELIYRLQETYWLAAESTGSREEAASKAFDSIDESLLDPSAQPKVSAKGMRLRLRGDPRPVSIPFGEKPPWEMPTLEEIQRVTHEKASEYMKGLARQLGDTRGSRLVVKSATASLTVFGRGVADRALRQIEEAEKGNLIDGPLPERELKLILMVRGVKIDETDN